jgi:PAS domain S-box-containing protein
MSAPGIRDAARAVAEVGRELAQTFDPGKVAARIVSTAVRTFRVRGSGLLGLDAASRTLTWLASAGEGDPASWVGRRVPVGAGVAGRAAAERRLVASPDIFADPSIRLPEWIQERLAPKGWGAVIAIPFVCRDEVLGVLVVNDTTGRVFSPEELQLLAVFADHAAVVLENARLYAEGAGAEARFRVHARQQAAIAALGQRALSSLDLDGLLDEAARLVAHTLEVEYAKVLELLPGGDALLVRAGVGWSEGTVGSATVAAGASSQAGYTLLTDEPVVVGDLSTERRFSAPPLLHDHGVVSGLSVIIGGRAAPFGVLGTHTVRRRSFSRDDAHFVQSVANVLATAIARDRADETLRESEARFRGAFEDSRIGRALQGLDGRYQRVNRALCEILDRSEAELLGTTWQALTHPEDLLTELAFDARMLAGETHADQMEKRYVLPSGALVWAALSVSLLRDAAGHPRYFLSEFQDITPRKQAEDALRQQAERLRLLHDIDQAIAAARSPGAIAEAALRRIRRLVPCQRASVTLFDLEARVVTILAADGAGGSGLATGTRFPLEDEYDIERLRTGETDLTEDLRSISPATPVIEALKAEGLRSSVRIPLLSHEGLVGSLNLVADVPAAFRLDQVEIAREVADSLAVALQDARLFAEVVVARQRLQALSRRLVEVQEAERRHLARELHDEIGQTLTGLKLTLETIGRMPPGAASARLGEARGLLDQLIARVRELSLDLRPAMLDDLGLRSALVWHFDRYREQTGVAVTFEHAGLERRFPPEVETAAYRIIQEALTNVVRHAGVRQVTVRVRATPDRLALDVVDQGRGFDSQGAGMDGATGGLLGMRERVSLIGGSLRVESASGTGTRVTAELPLGATTHDSP